MLFLCRFNVETRSRDCEFDRRCVYVYWTIYDGQSFFVIITDPNHQHFEAYLCIMSWSVDATPQQIIVLCLYWLLKTQQFDYFSPK